MNYRFEITKPDSSDFRCEIAIDADQTFQQFHDKIVETLGFDRSQMASFFALDKMGNRGKEIVLMDMSSDDEDSNTLVMDVTMIREVVNASCLELEYVYDFFSNAYLKVEYAGEYIGDSADVLPLCVYCEGELPHQTSFEEEEENWSLDKEDDDYDDSFLEEFGGSRSSGRRSRRSREEEDDYGFGEDSDDGYDDGYDDDYDDGFNDRFESLDDYIDKI